MTSRLRIPILIAVLLAVPLAVSDAYLLHVMILIFLNVMLAASMWLLGITGLISFGQAGFMFIGAMTSALLTKDLGMSFGSRCRSAPSPRGWLRSRSGD